MFRTFWLACINGVALASLAAIAFGFQAGALGAINAFVGALSVLAMFTGYQLMVREGLSVGAAVYSMLFEPGSYPARAFGYLSYIVSAILGVTVAVQAAAFL